KGQPRREPYRRHVREGALLATNLTYEATQEVQLIEPVPRRSYPFGAAHKVDGRGDGGDASQTGQRIARGFPGQLQDDVAPQREPQREQRRAGTPPKQFHRGGTSVLGTGPVVTPSSQCGPVPAPPQVHARRTYPVLEEQARHALHVAG